MALPMAVPLNWQWVPLNASLPTNPDFDMNLIIELVEKGLSSKCNFFKHNVGLNKVGLEKIFFNKQQIIDFIKNKNIDPNTNENVYNNLNENVYNNLNNNLNNNNEGTFIKSNVDDEPFYSKGNIKENMEILKNYIKKRIIPYLYFTSNINIDNTKEKFYNIIDNLNFKTLPDYYFNLQNKLLLFILSPYYNKKSKLHTVNYLLYDTESKNRSGRGVLGFISVSFFDLENMDPNLTTFNHRYLSDKYILPIYVNWTCSFMTSKKNDIKRNLSIVESSIAKFMTDRVCKDLLWAYNNIWSEDPIDAVLLFSSTMPNARPSHLRNGKLMACTFLYEWENSEGKNMYETYGVQGNSSFMYYMYPVDGTPFEPGNKLYDDLTGEYEDESGEINHVMADISTRKVKYGKVVEGYTEEAFECLTYPNAYDLRLSFENITRLPEPNYGGYGGKRRTAKKRKLLRRKTKSK